MIKEESRLSHLCARQHLILERIQRRETRPSTGGINDQVTDTVNTSNVDSCEVTSQLQTRLAAELQSKGIAHKFIRVPADYYDWDLESRRACLQAESTQHLCKSIVMENTKLAEPLPGLSKYYCVIVQYVARLHAEKLKRHLYQAHKAAGGALGTKAFNMRLCPEEVSNSLTGFEHNAVSPVGIATPDMPIVLSDRIVKQLQGSDSFMWLGGGEVDLKLGFLVGDFIIGYSPLIVDCTHDE
ncbi:hypothetical protein CVIRNUC_000751 [Coccomyxa viridis]|uniref:YbaK/aminoacyl-tRNA synthetase-associated domain-containing protein n=1 Tax=Coccomyxa viridis TaxID=1274662 RepID=A0AAV1HR87_9CHLO|nr:hypothetical protein CVIRNUC_000751 [Coccomyxa viridis]